MPTAVFISSSVEDSAPHYQAATQAVRDLGFLALEVLPQHIHSQDRLAVSLQVLAQSEIFVGLYAERYGAILPKEQLSLAERLYEEAIQQRLPRLVYILSPTVAQDIPNADSNGAMIRMFLDRLKADNPHLRHFSSPQDLADKLRFDLGRWKSQTQRIPAQRFQRRHFLLGLLLVWGGLLLLALLFGPLR
jgi:hypothetical protein